MTKRKDNDDSATDILSNSKVSSTPHFTYIVFHLRTIDESNKEKSTDRRVKIDKAIVLDEVATYCEWSVANI